MKNKSQAKNIALKVIQQLSSMRYFPAEFIWVTAQNYTSDQKLLKEVYAQARRALVKLGYVAK
jgi:hypothetical protein